MLGRLISQWIILGSLKCVQSAMILGIALRIISRQSKSRNRRFLLQPPPLLQMSPLQRMGLLFPLLQPMSLLSPLLQLMSILSLLIQLMILAPMLILLSATFVENFESTSFECKSPIGATSAGVPVENIASTGKKQQSGSSHKYQKNVKTQLQINSPH